MWQDIIDSKADSAILGFFLNMPERTFSVLEISKHLRQRPAKVIGSLSKLAEADLIKSFSKKGKRYYFLNFKYPLLPQMKNYWRKKPKVKRKDEFVNSIKKLGQIRAAFLSGIFCGQAHLPVDILLVGKVNLRKLAEFLKTGQRLMGQEINYSVMSPKEFVERRDTFDRFIKDIFDYRHLTVIDKLVKKRRG